jgi:hypothetical protein
MSNDLHHGSCHCGAVQFEVRTALTRPRVATAACAAARAR